VARNSANLPQKERPFTNDRQPKETEKRGCVKVQNIVFLKSNYISLYLQFGRQKGEKGKRRRDALPINTKTTEEKCISRI